MREIRITSETFRLPGDDPTIPDAYVDPAALAEVKKLAGIYDFRNNQPCTATQEVAQEKQPNLGAYQRDNDIKPGTEEWFRLWFSRKNLTGETPYDKD
jgi:hypothetical protein